ncbi:MAG TPA: Asp-tRNA(Asn)/Glu-tRNA(Gln) amidotransferase subunit GatB [Candidatus Kapabacteria bacterium]|nr:Asp-tRNA(Asn)/Glu-tRNA(Gln) amidotransferase subunit GatB [Candidatus Kapabacteria bacterium]HOV91500.1 Asp-tRNA(Asn)/Glu-tRNA(Gln) amidotransferase subunit GatB [Candidatus Kapabacteria bacterium]
MNNKYEAIIGLEVHTQLLTKSKAFCSCSVQFGDIPNTNTCPVCLGHPGSLPVLNEEVVRYAVKLGLATNCKIRETSVFARKNYFYEDLPKGYQISQYDKPICYDGFIEIQLDEHTTKKIGITRIHIEEDTGKAIHDLDIDTLLDYNRSGVPLLEIVSEPDIRTSEEAHKYLEQLRQILLYLGISSGNMEEGALRCDANVSVRLRGAEKFGTKTEVKNLNSFRNVQKALEYEIERQIDILENHQVVHQETMLWDAGRHQTRVMRTKEMAHDYRYFPEPDLLSLFVPEEFIKEIKKELPELPFERRTRFQIEYGLPWYDANILVTDKYVGEFYENAAQLLEIKNETTYKLLSNWIMTEVLRVLSEKNITISELELNPKFLAELVVLLSDNSISSRIAKDIFEEMISTKKSPKDIIIEKGITQISNSDELELIIKEIISNNQDSVEKYKSGKKNVFGFLVGQVMKQTQGKANPQIVNQILEKYLS